MTQHSRIIDILLLEPVFSKIDNINKKMIPQIG